MLNGASIVTGSQINTKHINVARMYVQLLNVKLVGASHNQ
jgi:hypothetical protein